MSLADLFLGGLVLHEWAVFSIFPLEKSCFFTF